MKTLVVTTQFKRDLIERLGERHRLGAAHFDRTRLDSAEENPG